MLAGDAPAQMSNTLSFAQCQLCPQLKVSLKMNITEYLVIKRIVVVSYPLDTGYKLKAKKKGSEDVQALCEKSPYSEFCFISLCIQSERGKIRTR